MINTDKEMIRILKDRIDRVIDEINYTKHEIIEKNDNDDLDWGSVVQDLMGDILIILKGEVDEL